MKITTCFCDCCEKEIEGFVNKLEFTLKSGDLAGTVTKELCSDCYWKMYYAQSDKWHELKGRVNSTDGE